MNQGNPQPVKKSHFVRNILILLLCSALALSALTASLFFLDQKGKLEPYKYRSHHSTEDSKGKYYRIASEPSTPTTSEEPTTSSMIPEQTSAPTESTETTESEIEGELSGYVIILDAGHGGRDTGAVYPFSNPTYHECDFNLHIAEQVAAELSSRGAEVYMLRTDDSWISLYARIAMTHLICLDIAEREGKLPFSSERADELRVMLEGTVAINEDAIELGGMGPMVGSGVGEDLEDLFEMEYQLDQVIFLSIHLNSSERRTLHGTQLYYVTDESVIESERNQMRTNSDFKRSDFPIREEYYGRHNEDNELLAHCMYDNIVGNLPELQTNANPVNADNYAVLREHGLTGVLIEVAYLSDNRDRSLLEEEENVKQISVSIGDGVVIYFHEKDIP